MTTILEGLWLAVIFLAGLIVRAALVVLVVAALAAPILLVLAIWKRAPALYQRLRGVRRVGGFAYRPRLAYAPGHVWLQRLASGEVRVGFDALASSLLRPVTRVRLPAPGDDVEAGRGAIHVRCGDAELQLPSPLTGYVTAANEALEADPGRVESDPYLGGWLLRVRPADADLAAFRKGRNAFAWFRREADGLARLLEQEHGYAAADGGEPVGPVAPPAHGSTWSSLVARFLLANLTPAEESPRPQVR